MPESGKKTTTVATENSNSQVNTVPVQNQSAPDKSADNNTTQNQEQSTTQEPKANLELLKQRLYDTVAAIFSRCGVPTANFRISDLVEFSASVSYSMNWNFKCRCSDKILRSVSDETHVLSTSALDEFTLANTKELEKDSAKTKEFVKHLSGASFEDLKALSGQIICFNRINAIGKTRCKTVMAVVVPFVRTVAVKAPSNVLPVMAVLRPVLSAMALAMLNAIPVTVLVK